MTPSLTQFVVPIAIVGALATAGWIGLRAGRRFRRDGEQPQFGIILSAILAILGLLLGFTFSGAMTRFTQRQEILVNEANAIGTAWLRVDLLDDARRARMQSLLREYTDARIELFHSTTRANGAPIQQRLNGLQAGIWTHAVDAAKAQPALMMPLLGPLNEMFDLLSTRNAAAIRHTPGLVLGVLGACALAALGSVGFGLASAERRVRVQAAVLGFLIAAAIWTTIDMDFPRAGLIRMDSSPLLEVREMMK